MAGYERLRTYVQAGAAILQNSYFFKDLKFCPTPALNCYACPLAVTACPMGSLQNLIIKGYLPLAIIGFLVSAGALIGRAACGWLCPFGFIQDLLAKIKVKRISISNNHGWTRYAVLLLLAVLAPLVLGQPMFCKVCPAGTLEAGLPLVIGDPSIRSMAGLLFALKVVILLAVIAAAIYIKRPFCRFLCPLGAIYSPFNRISALQMKVGSRCISCGACKSVCPMDMAIYREPASGVCIRCMACSSCAAVGASFMGKELIKADREGKIAWAAFKRQE